MLFAGAVTFTGAVSLTDVRITHAAEPGAVSPAVVELLESWRTDAAEEFSADRGRDTWFREVDGRSCPSCHTESLTAVGRHQKTGERIEPMAPSINPERLTSRKKINKWFLRNCKWTFGRECSAQEKGDILLWLSTQ